MRHSEYVMFVLMCLGLAVSYVAANKPVASPDGAGSDYGAWAVIFAAAGIVVLLLWSGRA